MWRRSSPVVGLVLVVGLFQPPDANATATFTGPCVSHVTWEFNPPLTRTIQAGTLTISVQATCVDVRASSDPPGESVRVVTGSTRDPFTYFGNCVTAQLAGFDIVATLLGGSALVVSSADSSRIPDGTLSVFSSNWAMTPDEVCNESTASGVVVGGPFILDV